MLHVQIIFGRNGRPCYRKCEGRVLLTNVSSGGLGAQMGGPAGETCLWILTVNSHLTDTESLSEKFV